MKVRNGVSMWHLELKTLGKISNILFVEDGSFVCDFTYLDQATKMRKKITAQSHQLQYGEPIVTLGGQHVPNS
jgi:hypothetical protein